MIEAILEGFGTMLRAVIVTLIISVPLGLWKLIEIVVWLFTHVSVATN